MNYPALHFTKVEIYAQDSIVGTVSPAKILLYIRARVKAKRIKQHSLCRKTKNSLKFAVLTARAQSSSPWHSLLKINRRHPYLYHR